LSALSERSRSWSLAAWALLGAALSGYFVGAPIAGLPAGVALALLWKRYRVAPRVIIRLPGVLELECYWLVRRGRSPERSS
jgi:hypothetical protein